MSDKPYTQEQLGLLEKVHQLQTVAHLIKSQLDSIEELLGAPYLDSVVRESCLLCKWNIRNTCRKHPPQMPVDRYTTHTGRYDGIDPRWVRVFPEDHCGAFEARTGEIPKDIEGREKSYRPQDAEELARLRKSLAQLMRVRDEIDDNKGLLDKYENLYHPFEFLRETTGDGK